MLWTAPMPSVQTNRQYQSHPPSGISKTKTWFHSAREITRIRQHQCYNEFQLNIGEATATVLAMDASTKYHKSQTKAQDMRHGRMGTQHKGLPLTCFCKEWVQHTSTFTFRSLILMRWKPKNYHPTFTISSPLPFSCQTNLLTKSPLQHSLYTRQPIFGCLGEMDRLLPVSYNWEVVDEMEKRRERKRIWGWNIVKYTLHNHWASTRAITEEASEML